MTIRCSAIGESAAQAATAPANKRALAVALAVITILRRHGIALAVGINRIDQAVKRRPADAADVSASRARARPSDKKWSFCAADFRVDLPQFPLSCAPAGTGLSMAQRSSRGALVWLGVCLVTPGGVRAADLDTDILSPTPILRPSYLPFPTS